jgi:hypothetical protein
LLLNKVIFMDFLIKCLFFLMDQFVYYFVFSTVLIQSHGKNFTVNIPEMYGTFFTEVQFYFLIYMLLSFVSNTILLYSLNYPKSFKGILKFESWGIFLYSISILVSKFLLVIYFLYH